METIESEVLHLYKRHYGHTACEISRIPVSGSNRVYFIITDKEGRKVVATVGTDVCENRTFLYQADHFRGKGLPVPEVYAVSDDERIYLQEYLGDISLSDVVTGNEIDSDVKMDLIERSVRLLPHLQISGAIGMDFSRCYPEEALNIRTISNDLSYFKYCFLKPSGVEFNESRLDHELETLRDIIAEESQMAETFMLRDFQSRNIMIKDGNPYVIDFQSGRRGPQQYDLVSFLWQAKAAFDPDIKRRMIKAYIDESLSLKPDFDTDRFRKTLPVYVLFRILQTLGAYGFRGWTERKPHFLRSIPKGVKGLFDFFSLPLDTNSEEVALLFPYLKELSETIISTHKVNDLKDLVDLTPYDGLTLTVSSFSFKRGVPYDLSGNGGGFVFDCRGIHNPGRYDEYKPLTGLDNPVKEFLEKDGEIFDFLSHCKTLVGQSLECYLSRGFSSLAVCFGCTGGHHRSVYSAEALGNFFAEKYPMIRVIIHHREQYIMRVLNSSD